MTDNFISLASRWPARVKALPRGVLSRLVQSIDAAPLLWREAPPVLRATREALAIPLRPSVVARWSARSLLAAAIVFAVELVLLAQLLAAAGVAAILLALYLDSVRSRARCIDRRLLITADGRLHLLKTDGRLTTAALDAASLQLGQWTLLVLRENGSRRCRFLLGPDNVDRALLAALKRRLGDLRRAHPAALGFSRPSNGHV